MKYRLEVDTAFNVRAKKGERKERGTGRLIKCQIWFGDDLQDCLKQASDNRAACEKIATPGYSEVLTVRGYDNETFKRDPLKAIPVYQAATLARA